MILGQLKEIKDLEFKINQGQSEIDIEFEEQRRGIGIEKPKKTYAAPNPLDSILKKVKSHF